MQKAFEPTHYDSEATENLAVWCERQLESYPDRFDAARQIARRLGGHLAESRDGGRVAEFGFWAPELVEYAIPSGDVEMEVLVPLDELSLEVGLQRVRFRRLLFDVERVDEFVWSAVRGLPSGSRSQLGAFYRLRYRDRSAKLRHVPDYVPYSVPFGAFAPAELYDVALLDDTRPDRSYFASIGDEGGRLEAPANILQLHVGTASPGGTLASLTRRYDTIAAKLLDGVELAPEDEPYVGYDAVQLLPIEPTTVFESGPGFWTEEEDADENDGAIVTVELHRPNTTNWGFDILIGAMSAVNPALLETGRPDELVDFIARLHNFPLGPIRVVFDVVFGHADNQALGLLNRHFFLGPNMYGQDVNYRHPVVRALLLEMQRRKVNFGADGVRVDGAQDFKWWDAESQRLCHDDEYLREMSAVQQEVAGVEYKPWFVFEDGRPWPRPDWELASTYRHVIEDQGHAYQWGPLTFAHNTPFIFTFWMNKWWRVREILKSGEQWISGCANHDTLRRGTQVNPNRPINHRLGSTLLEILDHAYDNPAAQLLTYSMLPGVPMDFLNASMRASWGFVRNTDDAYGVKIVAEESSFLLWQVDDISYSKAGHFRRLKDLGFENLDELRRFMLVLSTGVEATDYDLNAIVDIMNTSSLALLGPLPLTVDALKSICRQYMDDVHEYCNVSWYTEDLDPVRTAFNRRLRAFRRQRPWLRRNLSEDDAFDHRQPCEGSALYYGVRRAPDGAEELLFAANMEGAAVTVVPSELPLPGLDASGWELVLSTPRSEVLVADAPVTLHDSEGFLFRRVRAPN